jgi:hypothetical protein
MLSEILTSQRSNIFPVRIVMKLLYQYKAASLL